MEVKNSVIPNKDQMDEFLEGDIESPISMVNLLKFKEKAEYEDGRDTNLSGKEAYMIYGIEVQEHLKKVGGEIVFAVARYPSRTAMLEMMMDPDYQESEKHRSAGLLGQLNIETKEGVM